MTTARRAGALVVAFVVIVAFGAGCQLQTLGAPRGPLTLHAEFDDVQGLQVGNSVEINHVIVGSVTRIQLNQRILKADVQMSIKKGRDVPSDASATIRQATLLGEYFVDLSVPVRDPRDAPGNLKDGDTIRDASTTPPLEQVVAKAGALLQAVNANDLSAIINAAYQGIGGKGPELNQLVHQTSNLLAAFAARRQDLATVIDNFGALGRTLAPLSPQFETLLDNASAATTLLVQNRDKFFTTLNSFNQLLTVTNQTIILPHFDQFTSLVNEAATLVRVVSQQRQILLDLADNFANAVPRIGKAVSKDQVLVASWGEFDVGALIP